MHQRERLVNAYLAERLRRIRRESGVTVADLARRIDYNLAGCHSREAGLTAIGFDFLLRFGLTLGIPIGRIWFPAGEQIECLDDEVIRRLLEGWSAQNRHATERDVLEIAAAVFGLPVGAVTEGFQNRTPVQCRAAAALVVESHPLMKLAQLARLVSRTPAALLHARYKAKGYGPDFWRKVEAIRAEVESL